MDDVEKAILLTYDPSSSPDPAIRSQAMSFLDHIRSQTPSPSLLRLCLDLLRRSHMIPIHFWALQTLHDLIFHKYPSLSPSSDLPLLRSSLIALALSSSTLSLSPPFLKNKLAQTLAFLIRREYPSLFPSPFVELLPVLPSADPACIDFFSRLLSALDDDLISQDYPRTQEESAAAMRVKDAMRVQCVPQIVSFFFDAVNGYRSSDPNLAAAILETLIKYVSWIDIGLVANDAFLLLLFNLLEEPGSVDSLKSAVARNIGCCNGLMLFSYCYLICWRSRARWTR